MTLCVVGARDTGRYYTCIYTLYVARTNAQRKYKDREGKNIIFPVTEKK